ncbi:MAG TPA: VIT and VWA domain-containing protein [Blastocatellia bacterium]|nr:VIT and VWA domain-containing protein [Blastocatellia bacterium]
MKRTIAPVTLTRTLAALLGLLFCVAAANAQGIIIPEPCRRCPRPIPPPPDFRLPRALKIKSIHLTTRITDQVATTKVEQVFENDTPYTLEGTYFFPLPEGVSISEFAMWDGNKRLVGEVRAKAEARRIYDEIVRTRRDPALLEYAGKNLFQASVFPISPHSDKKIELIYTQVLRNDNGAVAYRYPLGTGWRASSFDDNPPVVRPAPRRPLNEAPGRISAEIEIDSKTAIRDIYSPSHNLEIRRDGERRARASFEAQGAQPDFQLFYTVSDRDFGLSLLTYREPAKEGYFMLRVAPKTELDERDVQPKDIVFVLDTSGSMADEGKMEKAKAALRQGIGLLSPRDHFNLISFAGEEHLLSARLIEADEAGKRQAREFVERMRPTGGTNINDAMVAALGQLSSGERPRMIVLITDGQPTVGTTNAAEILRNVKKGNRTGARVFTFGVGYDVNTVLLDGMAAENSGAADYIEPNEDIEVKVSNFFAKVNYPVLSDVRIDWGGAEVGNVYPRNIPDIFHGSQLVLIGRYRPQASRAAAGSGASMLSFAGLKSAGVMLAAAMTTYDFGLLRYFSLKSEPPLDVPESRAERRQRITLIGRVNGTERRFVYDDVKFPERESSNEFLPQLWAMRRVGHLMEQIRLNGESRELREEIIELGTRYNIVTPYTSYLVLEPGMQAQQFRNESDRHALQMQGAANSPQPLGTPGGSAGRNKTAAKDATGADLSVQAAPMSAPVAGQSAVALSKRRESLNRADKLSLAEAQSSAQTRTVAGRTFYLRDGVWTDSEFRAEAKLPEIKVKFGSEAYFNLLSQEPKLGDFFALGERVVVVWNGKVYRVED